MIGVIYRSSEYAQVKEFFQLFKTPWETYNPRRRYKIVLSSCDIVVTPNTNLLILFDAKKNRIDELYHIAVKEVGRGKVINFGRESIPIYGRLITFAEKRRSFATVRGTEENAAIVIDTNGRKILRIGYNLFEELRILFSKGQPKEFSFIPTLDVHISLLRRLILLHGISLIEVPPTPYGYPFICCLTHDVDFLGIRYHKLDHTFFGFVYRALISSMLKFFSGKMKGRELAKNILAVLNWPAVAVGLRNDFWNQLDQYMQIENDLASTFFFLPFKNHTGKNHGAASAKKRGCKYDVQEHIADLRKLVSAGCEIGVHGIDAWADEQAAVEERNRIAQVAATRVVGTRIHWLYYDVESPKRLEDAGYLYDSTLGYNDSVGYWAGCCQAFKPFNTKELLELPLHIQDTSLFYPSRMGLEKEEALNIVNRFMENAVRFGGTMVFNWHQRSLAPERLWGDFYLQAISCLRAEKPWFAMATQAVNWFKLRRMVTFECGDHKYHRFRVKVGGSDSSIPALTLRVYSGKLLKSQDISFDEVPLSFVDHQLEDDIEITVP